MKCTMERMPLIARELGEREAAGALEDAEDTATFQPTGVQQRLPDRRAPPGLLRGSVAGSSEGFDAGGPAKELTDPELRQSCLASFKRDERGVRPAAAPG